MAKRIFEFGTRYYSAAFCWKALMLWTHPDHASDDTLLYIVILGTIANWYIKIEWQHSAFAARSHD